MSPFRGSIPFTQESTQFRFNVADQVANITFTRPDKLNALTFEGYADLRDLLHEIPSRGDVRVIVLRGEGTAFSSGGDVHEIIGELLKMHSHELLDFTRMTGEVVKAMRECPVPIVAVIHGIAAGAGSVLALASDFRIVSRSGKFAFLFTKVGLAGADMGSAYLLPRLIGLGRATQLLMLGDTISAEVADKFGLVSVLVEDEEIESQLNALVHRLVEGPAFAYAQTKALLSRELDMSLSGALELEAMTQALLMTTEDYAEFYKAFSEKRAPTWKGR
ncbi:enoyl-CoA hydratase family protein [Ferrimicrobium acidiphilum]|uniref:1,2-epoxyphenylacetyl-CoA isomerase n=1 Tax=Ferrimicrobium acidiphilum DSM 19497 TaxID=1121877 RepID=A0A0D8FQ71_9ACTN|nr:enoyl-CoA hydratase family protein [Ferrimicrobium acidiphilum]KJE75440.1 1,2-epoxyphenylacetyl-CoA isomerase [Ferrimicrobium acidiphilum DSM 19497]